jgi:anti-anti-sigma factor
MEIAEARERGAVIVAPTGRIDSTTSDRLERHLTQLLGAGERRIVVDFARVEYISSAGLRVMLALAKRMKDARGAVALCAMGEPVRQVFDLAGFLPLFAVDGSARRSITTSRARKSSWAGRRRPGS